MKRQSPNPAAPCREQIDQAGEVLSQFLGEPPELVMVLGSGFAAAPVSLSETATIAFPEIPGFCSPTVAGHAGELTVGSLHGKRLALLRGRVHYYEGYTMSQVTFPVRALAAVGMRQLLLTNAAGGIRQDLRPGSFMVVRDHINHMGVDPLRGAPEHGQERFLDLTHAYDPELSNQLMAAGSDSGLTLCQGTYLAVSGPCFETPAEIAAYRTLGADAVGMSTVPEVVVARQCQVRVAALSLITNRAAGLGQGNLSHADVLRRASLAGERAGALLESFVRRVG